VSDILYSIGQYADCAYLLRGGEIEYRITDKDSIRLSGNGIIVGASEILLAMSRKEAVPRHASLARGSAETQINAIPAAKLASFITTYAVGFSVAHHIAETITKLHPLLANKMSRLDETERFSRDLARFCVESLQLLEQEAGDRNFPWLITLIAKGKAGEAYTFGLSMDEEAEEKKLDVSSNNLTQYKQFYPKDTVICKEGEKAEDMFILVEGKIEVSIRNRPIDIINRKSMIIGEMGLILGQPRTATLRALADSNVIRINARDMENIFKSDPDTFFNMLASLAFRERVNCEKIREFSDKVGHGAPDRGEYTLARLDAYAREYAAFVLDLSAAAETHPEMDWLGGVAEMIQRKATGLLSQVGTVTGELYSIHAPRTDEARAPEPRRRPPPRGEAVPKIDWF